MANATSRLLTTAITSLLALLLVISPVSAQDQTPTRPDSSALARAAAGGDAAAQYELGKLHLGGRGLQANHPEAVRWLRAAMEQGHPGATFQLGLLHDAGIGVPLDRAEGRRLYELAAERNSIEALTLLSGQSWIEGDHAASIAWLRRAAILGDIRSAFGLASLYEEGVPGVLARDEKAAFTWYLRVAIASGDTAGTANPTVATARTIVGLAFLHGDRTTQDYAAALQWLRLADTPEAHRELGKIYLFGFGVERNVEMARYWFEKAAASGDEAARKLLHEFPPDPP